MTHPTITGAAFTAFVDLTARPDDCLRIVSDTDRRRRHTLYIAPYESPHVVLHLSTGSLAILRDFATAHLTGDPDA